MGIDLLIQVQYLQYNMGFFTKVDYSRQLRQLSGTSIVLSGSTSFGGNLNVSGSTYISGSTSISGYTSSYIPTWVQPVTACTCAPCSTGFTFIVGPFSTTSASCNVTITSFSAATGVTQVLAIGQPPLDPITGGTASPGVTASTLQISNAGLIPYGTNSSSAIDLQLDEDGNVVRGNSSSLRYKTRLENVAPNRYSKLLTLNPKFFTYKETGRRGFGLIAEDLDRLGYRELVIYNRNGQPENIEYKLLSVALIDVLKNIGVSGPVIVPSEVPQITTKVVTGDYTTNGEYLIVGTESCKITLNSTENKKIKIKSLNGLSITPDIGLIDDKWKSISLDGDSCIELVFVSELNYWVIVSSDGLKDS